MLEGRHAKMQVELKIQLITYRVTAKSLEISGWALNWYEAYVLTICPTAFLFLCVVRMCFEIICATNWLQLGVLWSAPLQVRSLFLMPKYNLQWLRHLHFHKFSQLFKIVNRAQIVYILLPANMVLYMAYFLPRTFISWFCWTHKMGDNISDAFLTKLYY